MNPPSDKKIGKLKVLKKGKEISYQVMLTSKKGGSAQHSIPDGAAYFDPNDAVDGVDVEVTYAGPSKIGKVVICGKPEKPPKASPPPTPPRPPGGSWNTRPGAGGPRSGMSQLPDIAKISKASPRVLGMAFHNPFTFLPFATQPPKRRTPTLLSADELPGQTDRWTGVLELTVVTRSPLLTCESRPVDPKSPHKSYRAMTIGPDVIVPATGIRGSLRTLLTVVTGGTLGHFNRHAHLVQGRDVNLGPSIPTSKPEVPDNVFLAEVVRPGTEFASGVIRLGQTKLVPRAAIESKFYNLETFFKESLKSQNVESHRLWAKLDAAEEDVAVVSDNRQAGLDWRIKLSGRPVNKKGKREGLFRPDGVELEIPPELWADYVSRHAGGDRPELRRGDLIWLEPNDPRTPRDAIRSVEQIASLQWSRWGKKGKPMKDFLPASVLPDYLKSDGLVDEVTDLFGQASSDRDIKATTFAARLRPENLVFRDGATKLERRVTLAPLQPPHPGCIAFYRKNTNPDGISAADQLRGYKVYRTTKERGAAAPWHYNVQGVYDKGRLNTQPQKVNKTCDLLTEGCEGKLRIAFRALTARELAMLVQACQLPWRLGGGKPLGLGHCSVRITRLLDENGDAWQPPGWTAERQADSSLRLDGWQAAVEDLAVRAAMWTASQEPVSKLRYPRAVTANDFQKQRGGHAWFARHASPRKGEGKEANMRKPGLEVIYIKDPLKTTAKQAGELLDDRYPAVAGQVLPPFDPVRPQDDLLYGYDGFEKDVEILADKRKIVSQLDPFDVNNDLTGQERSQGNHGNNAEKRDDQKKRRPEDEP